MIELYTWKTANCQKVNIALCEIGLPFRVHPIDLTRGEQKSADHLARNPNGKVPVVTDTETGITLFESGAILLYLANKARCLMPEGDAQKWRAIQWIFWQMAGLGPNAAQVIHFSNAPDGGEEALTRFRGELERLFGVLERELTGKSYLVEDYSMADISIWPWVSRFRRVGLELYDYPEIKRWYLAIADRPGVVDGVRLLQPEAEIAKP
ncbi:glutathione S-transferase family protein [Roseibium marinum]|uniref:GST-like protein n=1 Tax=Roseibium marinum TaxID=281252 RepID=A0A2S3UJM3_9HYPH|nr:glutathione S-transferase family protein [Roseibium marinum]POF27918.1 GST-like protein [Roseibium marinum]